MPRTVYDDPEAEKHFHDALSKVRSLVTDEPNETYVAKSTPGKGDQVRNQTKRSDRYGGADLPTARKGTNEYEYNRSRRDLD